MRMSMRYVGILAVVLSIVFVRSAHSDLIVNEVLSNEPGTSVTLEWFEFFNSGSTSENLDFFQIQIGANTLVLDTTGGPIVLQAGEYIVICRNLIGDSLSLGCLTRRPGTRRGRRGCSGHGCVIVRRPRNPPLHRSPRIFPGRLPRFWLPGSGLPTF